MRKSITVNIPEPCHEDWNKMTPKEQGRHCASCNKTVIDFTTKTDEQIIKTFETEGNLCGRFKKQQLNREIVLARKSKNNYMSLAASGLFAFMALGNQDIHAQGSPRIIQTDSVKIPKVKGKIATSIIKEKVITGTVTTASDGLPLPGTNVIIKGTARGAQTDFDGLYTIKAKIGETLVFSFVGFDTQEFIISENTSIKVAMIEDNSLEEIFVVGGAMSLVGYSYDYHRQTGLGVFSRTKTQRDWLAKNKQKRTKWKAERRAKREAIKTGKQERTTFGKFFFSIKSLFSKK